MQDLNFRKKRKKRNIKNKNRIKYKNGGNKKYLRQKRKKRGLSLYFPKDKLAAAARQPKEILRWAVEIVAVCLLAFILVVLFGQRVSNAGDAMSPVLKNGDVLLVDRMVYNAKKPARGDIIAFKPNGNENAHYSVKRIVGLPGETVQIQDGQVYIDGEVLVKDIYSYEIVDAGVASEEIELKSDEYFVLGDNHESSVDSRMADIGNVKREDIYGKIWFVASGGTDFGFVKN